MKKRIIEWLLCVIIAAGLFGCDGGSDGGTGGGFENQDLTAYEDEASALLEHTFSGTIVDGGHEVPCRFDGDEFEFYLQLASPLTGCEDTEGQPADCTNAATGIWELEGDLEVDFDTFILTGSAVLFGSLCDVAARLTTDLSCYRNSFGDGALDSLSFESEISQIDWNIQNDEEHTDEWEVCLLNVESID